MLVFRRKYHLTVRRAVPSSLDPTLSSPMEPLYLICTTMSSPSHTIPSLIPTGSSTSQHSTRSLNYLCSF
ncbi:hypothetical protein BDR05DRAFT_971294, partial [Suillus weaverae]